MKKTRRSTTSFASYRLFELLKFLSNNSATIPEIIEYLSSIDPTHRKYTSITVYKYFNTLRTMGLPLKKKNYKYYLEKLPFSFNFSKDDIKALKIMSVCAEHMPEKTANAGITSLIENLSSKISNDKKDYYKELDIIEPEFKDHTDKEKKLISEFEKYSKEGLKVCVSYRDEKTSLKNIVVDLVDIIYKEGKIYFNVYDSLKGCIINIPLKQVVSLEQLTQKSKGVFVPTTVTYKIKGRLKETYVLRDYETLASTSENESVIVNKGEDETELLRRLFGYCDLCEIISPKSYKEKMIEELDCMLKNYA